MDVSINPQEYAAELEREIEEVRKELRIGRIAIRKLSEENGRLQSALDEKNAAEEPPTRKSAAVVSPQTPEQRDAEPL